ncbi:MAG: tRNA (adenine-N1)-methyltransferase [Candidatus Kaelpia aquatica]|nr:tRNA (adenine-N1)-methyltransferase [Candidatus Kaelpia aquatica]
MSFKKNELVIVRDDKNKTYLQKLDSKGRFQSHVGIVHHKDMIGKEEGEVFLTSTNREVSVFYPTLNDFIHKMGRKTAIIHPKDIGIILFLADIKPGDRIVEAGTGSGALLLALSRYVGKKGHIYSYDNRSELQDVARKNLEKFYNKFPSNVTLKQQDISNVIDEDNLDAIVLDFSQPWEVIPEAVKSLRRGGSFSSYIPTIIQAERFVKELEATESFLDIEIVEVLLRPWQIKGYSVRPQHRMVGHTGFMVFARFKGSPNIKK